MVVYRVRHLHETWMSRTLLTLPWFASPNLLAAREILEELCFHGEGPPAVDAALARCFDDAVWRERCIRGPERAAQRLASGRGGRAARQAEVRQGPPARSAPR